jgi:hypothetical protein
LAGEAARKETLAAEPHRWIVATARVPVIGSAVGVALGLLVGLATMVALAVAVAVIADRANDLRAADAGPFSQRPGLAGASLLLLSIVAVFGVALLARLGRARLSRRSSDGVPT